MWLPLRAVQRSADPLRALPQAARHAISAFIARGYGPDSNECVRFGMTVGDPILSPASTPRSLNELVAEAPNVFVGRVTQIASGFWYGTPASVAEVRVDEWLRSSVTQSDTVYFVFPVADFRVARFRLCAVDERWPRTPRVGGRVAVASLYPPANDERLFQPGLTPYEVFLEDDSGSTIPPSALSRAGAMPGDLAFDALLDLLRGLTSEREAQGGAATRSLMDRR